ncbi:MAG TPA: class I SAM-dependent methyltransferase [Pirellulaceae bacterium]|nr:class I SAM-dependent methyltransferase [Pirellulaceae bacterium]
MLSKARRTIRHLLNYWRGLAAGKACRPTVAPGHQERSDNPLEAYFDSVADGPGIYKWRHYFEIYHRHLSRFAGTDANLLEVGIYSGGGLAMWQKYLGRSCRIFGVDIEPACKAYETDRVQVFVGDQADRSFWAAVRAQVPRIDVFIDDGGHTPEQQMVTLEEMLPHLASGGVYICEDIHGRTNGFGSFVAGLQQSLNDADFDGKHGSRTSDFQQCVGSIHLYPFVLVIEKTAIPVDRLASERHGTLWQPFKL